MKLEKERPMIGESSPRDLRAFLDELKRERPNDLLVVDKEVSVVHEMSALLVELENRNRYPVVQFTNTRDHHGNPSPFPVISNLFASRARNAWTMNSTSEAIPFDYYERLKNPIAPVYVESAQAPVHEVVDQGDAVDLLKFPIPVHHEWDPGPYITAGMATMSARMVEPTDSSTELKKNLK